ncbi:MAG: hypothetical protein JO319_01270 [Acidobacteriaceae bacterium]|nr:hypothetical protein [Acidobacteriaceae bacterium]
MRRHFLFASICLLAVTGAVQAASISDGNFGTPSVAGGPGFMYNPTGSAWIFAGTSGLSIQNVPGTTPWFTVTPPGGSGQAAFLQNYVGPLTTATSGIISQSVSGLTVGDTYTLSFYAAQRPNYSVNPFTVTMGSTTLGSVTPGSVSFALYNETFTAISGTELLSFTSNPGPAGNFDVDSILANVNLAPGTATPEPATFALMLPLLAGLVWYSRRRANRKHA